MVLTFDTLNLPFTEPILLSFFITYQFREAFILNKNWENILNVEIMDIAGIKCLTGRIRSKCRGGNAK